MSGGEACSKAVEGQRTGRGAASEHFCHSSLARSSGGNRCCAAAGGVGRVPAGHPGSQPGARLKLLGTFQLTIAFRQVKVSVHAERLLALLAIRPGTHRRSWAAGVLWPELPQSQAKAKLRSVIWRLPETHRPHVLRLTDGTIALADDVPVDLHESIQAAEWLVDSSLRLDAEQLHGMPLDGLTQDLLPHLCDEQWLMTDQERFRQLRLHALEALCYRLAEIRAYSAALNAGLEAVCADPLRESARRAVIQVFLLEGNRSDAVRQLESYRKVLRKELGIAPSPELTRLLGGALVTSASPGGRPGVNGILAARERAAGGLRLPGAAR